VGNQIQIKNIFPTPIGIIKVPPYFSNIIPILEKFEHNDSEEQRSLIGTRSTNSYVLNDINLKPFKKFILQQSLDYGKHINVSCSKYKITQSWITYKSPNESHAPHTHPNSIISGIFYWGKTDENTPPITFHKPIVTNTWEIQPSFLNMVSFYELNVIPGNIILFPSFLPHSVRPNNTSLIRKSLSFNIVPKKGFGDEEYSTELKFN